MNLPPNDRMIRHDAQVADDVFQYLTRHPEVLEQSAVSRDVLADLAQLPVTKLDDDHPQFGRFYR